MQLGSKLPLGSKRLNVVIVSTVLCLMTIVFAACGGGNTTGTGSSGGTKAPDAQQVYRWGFTLPDINSFDPGIATDATSINAINLAFTGLVQLDNNLEVQPQLASSYDMSPDGLSYTFHLRPDLKFSDGSKLDANDVAYSIDRSMSPAINNQSGVASTYLGLIKGSDARLNGTSNTVIGSGVVVKDPNTLQINLNHPGAYFLGALSYPTSFVVQKSVIEKWGDKWTDHLSDNGGQGGAGPFMVKKYDHSTGITFIPNPNYYGPKPQLKEIDYLPFKDGQTSYNSYLAGQTDYTGVPAAQYTSAKTRNDFSSTKALTIFYLAMNYKVKPLDNIKVRQALALALNRDTINQAAYSGAYSPSCHIVPEGMYGFSPNLQCPLGTDVKGDATKAKQLLDQGLSEDGVGKDALSKITLTYPSQSPATASEVTTMQQMWKQALDVNFATTTASQNSIYNLQAQTTGHDGPLQMWTAGWGADFPDPQDWISLQFGKGAANNNYNYGNNPGSTVAQQQALQQQMAQADVMQDRTARAAAYNKIEQQLVDDVAWLSLYQRPDLRLLNPKVNGLTFNAISQIPPNEWANVYKVQ